MLPQRTFNQPVSSLNILNSSDPKQLNISNARPGIVEASLRIEPYNGELHILAYPPLLTLPCASKVNRVGVRLHAACHILLNPADDKMARRCMGA